MLFIPATLIGRLLLMSLVLLSPPQTQQRGRRHAVEVHNHTRTVVERIYMSSSTESNWGEDRLGNGTLDPDHYLPLEVPTGDYDFKFIDKRKRECTLNDITIAQDSKIEIYEDSSNAMRCRHKDDID
jgi:hypothetical protein